MRDIGICLIGAGRAGMIHALNIRNGVTGAFIAAVADTSEEACRNACESLDIDRYYLDYRKALDQKDIGAVIVVSPTKFHKDIVVAAANAGKHIFCEKPMAMNEKECDEMIKAVEDNKVKLQLGFMRRFDAGFAEAKKAIESGAIGEIVQIRSVTRGPSRPREWMYDIDVSNGPLAEVNSHDIDCIRWLTGSEIAEVYAVAGNYRCKEIRDEYPDFYDNVVLTGKLKNGVTAIIEGSQYVKYGYDARTEVLGTEGVIHIGKQNGLNYTAINVEKGISTPFVTSWTELFKDAYIAEDRHFVECVLNDKQPAVSGIDGKMVVSVVNAGNMSIKEKRTVKF